MRYPHPDTWGFTQIETHMPEGEASRNASVKFVKALGDTVKARGEILNVRRTAAERVALLDEAAARLGALWTITPEKVLVVRHASIDLERDQ